MAEDDDGLVPLGPKSAAPNMTTPATTDPIDPLRPIGDNPLTTAYAKVPSNENGGGSLWHAISRDLSSISGPHWPGSSPPQLAPGLGKTPAEEGHLVPGLTRGIRDVFDPAAAWLASRIGGDDTVRQENEAGRKAYEAAHGDSTAGNIGRVGGQVLATAGPLRVLGRLAAGGASMLPGAVGRAAQYLTSATPAPSTIGRTGQLALQGAGTGAVQSGLTSSAYDLPLDEQMFEGGLTGGFAGPAIGGLTKAIDVLRGFSGGVRPDVADLGRTAIQYGVTPPVTSLTANPQLRMMADALQKLPLSGADTAALAKQRDFQRAITAQMGSTADKLSPATMKETADRLNRGYNDLYANAPRITGGTPLITDLSNVGTDAGQFLVGDQAGAMAHVGNAIQKVSEAFRGGSLDPRAYKSLMGANDGTLARIEDAAPSAAQPYLQKIRDAVRDRFAASAGPAAAATLKELDRQWRVMKTVQPLAEKSTLGDVGPGGLMQQVVNASRKFDGSTGGIAYTGGGPLGDLGRVGKQFFGHVPESGTAPRMQALKLSEHPVAGTIAALPGILAGRPLQAWLNNPTVAQRMINTSLGGPRPDISRALPFGLLGPIDYLRDPAGP